MRNPQEKKLGLGIMAGVSTGVFWGLPFLVPQILGSFSSIEVVFGRFFFFGLISLFFIKPVISILKILPASERLSLFFLSAAGFWFYAILLFWGVQETNGVISSLIVGMIPVVVPLFTPGRSNSGFHFFLGLSFLLLGLLNLLCFPLLNGISMDKPPSLGGIIVLVICMALWSWYVIGNTQFLKRNPQIDHKYHSSVFGVVSLICLAPLFFFKMNLSALVSHDQFLIYLVSSMALGFGSSWFANWLWNICSDHCPSEISGPLIISETLFGLIYSFIFEGRWPHGYEWVSIALFLMGVTITIRSQIRISRSS